MSKPRPNAPAGSGRQLRPSETRPGTPAWRRARAREIVRDHTLLAAGANFIPVPIVDSLALAAVQLKMIAALSRLYGVNFDDDLGRNLLASFGIGFTHHVFAHHSAGLGWKLAWLRAPVLGRVVGFALWPVVFAYFTHVLGEACADHYAAGGQFDDFTAARLVNTPVAPLAVNLMNKG